MPGMNGQELARLLRETLPADQLRLIALTGHGKSTEAAQAAEFDEFLLKPAGAQSVVEALVSLEDWRDRYRD